MPSLKRRHLIEIQEKVFLYIRLQRFTAAEDLLKSTLQELGPLPNLLNLMGIVFHRQSQFSQAIDYFEQAKAANPRFIEAALNLSVTLSDLGFYDQAERVYQEMQNTRGEGKELPDLVLGRLANLHNTTALGYEHAGLLNEAVYEFQKALHIFPRMPDVRLRLAKIFMRLSLQQQAKEQLLILNEDNPNHAETLNLLGAISYKIGDTEQAKRYWQKSQNLNPHDKTSKTYIRSTEQKNAEL